MGKAEIRKAETPGKGEFLRYLRLLGVGNAASGKTLQQANEVNEELKQGEVESRAMKGSGRSWDRPDSERGILNRDR